MFRNKLRIIVDEVDNGYVVTSYDEKSIPMEKKIAHDAFMAVVEVASILKANVNITHMDETSLKDLKKYKLDIKP